MTFGEKIKSLRKENNWKQEDLAEKIGTDIRQISLYENGKTLPSIETVIKIARAFNISIDYLLIDEVTKKPLYLSDNALFDKLQKIDLLTKDEKDAIFKIIDGLTYKNKIKNVIAEVH